MKKRTKNKNSGGAGSASGGKTKKLSSKKYESHYLAIVLIAFLLLEGCLISATNTSDWQKGLQVLDVSGAVSQTFSDATLVFQPVTMAADNINQFYVLASDQMAQLLDLSGTDPLNEVSMVASGVNDFYQQSAIQMAQMLDMSSLSSWPGNLAGSSVTVQ
jgi:hypothetical protein